VGLTPARYAIQRRSGYKRKYGITVEEYDAMLRDQGGHCAICDAVVYDRTGRRLAVDHDHATGRVRGLLCYRCNALIDHLSEDGLFRAITYLKEGRL
jgi:hypothetical protein